MTKPEHDVKAELRAAYEAGKQAVRYFDRPPQEAPVRPPAARGAEQEGWHH